MAQWAAFWGEAYGFSRVGDCLDGEDIVPGFSLPVAELFAEWEF